MAINLQKAGDQVLKATFAPPKSALLYDKMNEAILTALRVLSGAGGEFALDAAIDAADLDETSAKAINLLASQTSQELHAIILSKAITNAIIDYLNEHVTTQISIQATDPAPGPVTHPHTITIQPIRLVAP